MKKTNFSMKFLALLLCFFVVGQVDAADRKKKKDKKKPKQKPWWQTAPNRSPRGFLP